MEEVRTLLNRPEYIHAAINHFPLIGVLVAMLALLIALFTKSRAAILTGLALVCLLCLSVWPVFAFGEQGFDRVLSMSDEDGQAFLRRHQHLADTWAWLYYVAAGVAALAFGLAWKWPRTLKPLSILTLLLGAGSLAAGIVIAQAGGEIRHREFRTGPPPAHHQEAP
jgi:hypothetical protein